MMMSACSTRTRLASATRCDTSALKASTSERSSGEASDARKALPIAASCSASSSTRARAASSSIAAARALACGSRQRSPASSARASETVVGRELSARFSALPNGSGTTSSHPRRNASRAESWSTPSARTVCRRVRPIGCPNGVPLLDTASSTISRIRERHCWIRGPLASHAAWVALCPVTPSESLTQGGGGNSCACWTTRICSGQKPKERK